MRAFIPIVGLLLLLGCGEDQYDAGDFFYLVNKGAKMPVIVRGNIASKVMLVFIHGGPGGTAIQKIGLPAFNKLEDNYSMVFWDQRGSGSSQGNVSNESLNLDQFVEDLDKLVDLLRYKYHEPEIFLMGHSWGGCLGTAYLTDDKRQDKIRGWIEIDGAHNNPMGDDLSLLWITNYARAEIAKGVDVDLWTYALGWYAKNPDFTSDQMEHYAFLEKAQAYVYDLSVKRDPAKFPYYSIGYVFNSPADVAASLTNYNRVITKFVISDIDLTSNMSKITIPSLIIWGKQDGVIPYAMAQQAHDALGTSTSQKEIVTLMNSAHFGYYEQPETFASAVKLFVDQYK
jgi:proline iminopeptidase